MAFYRHFFERHDFDICVATTGQAQGDLPYRPLKITAPPLLQRLFRTRFLPWLYGPHLLTSMGRVPRVLLREAEEFRPDAIFTIAGTWDWTALLAQAVARKMKVPLIASFNDWFDFGWFPAHPIYRSLIESRFRRFYREADLALCTSEGMSEELGAHRNVHVLYPLGSSLMQPLETSLASRSPSTRFVIGFAGTLAGWYGSMLERLVRTSFEIAPELEFKIFGSNDSWGDDFRNELARKNIFYGHLPFEEVSQEMQTCDALLLPMGFERHAEQIERTSFKTKFLDYIAWQRPVIVWGPQYCSAVRSATEFDSAEVCVDSDESVLLDRIKKLAENSSRQAELVQNAQKMYHSRFHPDIIHGQLVAKIENLIAQRSPQRLIRSG
jgi:glycosyltransferase involved in cell wall biosynthesis